MGTISRSDNPLFAPFCTYADQIGFTVKDLHRYLLKIQVTTECWLWIASKTQHGYGSFNHKGKIRKSHRIAWQLVNGPIPANLCVCHQCDVTSCVNPAHLFIGSQADNVRDMISKKRDNKAVGVSHWSGIHPELVLKGERNGRAKITAEKVKEIRASAESCAELARRFRLGETQISRIRKRESWSSVD